MDCQKESEKILRLAQRHSIKNLGTAPGSEVFLSPVGELPLP